LEFEGHDAKAEANLQAHGVSFELLGRMDIMNPMLQSFLSTALPIVIAVLFGTWANNKRLDDFARRLDRIETLLDKFARKSARRRTESLVSKLHAADGCSRSNALFTERGGRIRIISVRG
jgi:uncharacterized DUF497 family protein